MTDENTAAGESGDASAAADAADDSAQPTGQSAETDELEAARRQAEDNWHQYLRAVAELDNLRKRNAREVENARRFGIERFLNAILPVRDSLEAGLDAAQAADAGSVEFDALVEGEKATLRLLDQALESAGIVEIDPAGEPFDPERHEAMSMLPSQTAEPNSVLEVIQKGYALHERVVRPARVIVAQAAPAGDDGNS